MRCLAESGQFRLELADLRAHNVGAGADHLEDRILKRLAKPPALGLKVDERDHARRLCPGSGAQAKTRLVTGRYGPCGRFLSPADAHSSPWPRERLG